MWRGGIPITVRGYYIVDTYHRDLYNFFMREKIVSTDHRMILDKLKGGKVSINCKYCKGRTTWPIVEPKGVWMRE